MIVKILTLGYSVMFSLIDMMMQFVASVLVESGDTLRSCGSTGFSTTCLGAPWLLHAYEGSIRVGAVLAFFAICIGVAAGIFQHFNPGPAEPSPVMRVLFGAPKLALVWCVIVAMTAYSVSMFDALAFWWADWAAGSGSLGTTGVSVEDMNDLLSNVTGSAAGVSPQFDMSQIIGNASSALFLPAMIAKLILVILVYVLMVLAMFMIGVVLVVRSVMIQVVLLLSPMIAVTLLTKWADTMKMLMRKLLGLILIKPVIVIVLGLGSAILSGSGTGGGAGLFQPDVMMSRVLEQGFDGMLQLMGELVVGLVTLFVAAMSPSMVMGLVEPQDGGGAMAAGSPGRAGGKAMQYGYYGRMFKGGGGGRGAAGAGAKGLGRLRGR